VRGSAAHSYTFLCSLANALGFTEVSESSAGPVYGLSMKINIWTFHALSALLVKTYT